MLIGISALIIFILILSFLVFVHELGHFLTAKRFGVEVEEFGIGIPPRIFGKKVGDTVYSLNALPFGGFVKIKGEDNEGYDPKDKTNFMNKKPWQRAIVLVAGIFMNTVIGITLFYIVLANNNWSSNALLLINDYDFKYGQTVTIPNVVTFIENDSPAQKAGIEFADSITKLEYMEQSVEPKTVEEMRAFVSDKADKEIKIYTKNINTDQVKVLNITPVFSENINAPAMGVALSEGVYLSYYNSKYLSGIQHSANVINYSFYALKGLVKTSVETKDVSGLSQGVAGPIGIFGAVKSVLEVGGPKVPAVLLDLTAILSLSLALMNILPIPALDGGRLTFVVYEWITKKRPSQKIEAAAHRIGYAFLLGLLVLITFKDLFVLIFR
jgi:regulator of sigma E protease